MGKFFQRIQPEHRQFITQQQLFFVATAPLQADGHVNLSPKGHDSFRVLDERNVAYMDLYGSGNETSAHLQENGRITFMFCAFEGPPNILRLYGKGAVVLPGDERWDSLAGNFPAYPGARQIILATVDLVQTSCGFGVPLYHYSGERDQLHKWASHKGPEGLRAYGQEKNARSLDGIDTPLGLTLGKI